MEEVLKSTDNFIFTTSTADVMSPDDFVIELFDELPDMSKEDHSVIKIKNLDELLDFLEKTDW
jgi:hypothetical protein